MERFILDEGIVWQRLYSPFLTPIGDMEDFGTFLDEAIEFHFKHSRKTSIPLVYLKEFYND